MIEIKGDMCRIKVVKEVLDIYELYRPEVGKVYDAEHCALAKYAKSAEFVILDVLDKKIVLRKGEYEEVCA